MQQQLLSTVFFRTVGAGLFFLFLFATAPVYLPAQSTPVYEDEYALLLSRMVEKGVKSPNDGDVLGPVKYWQDLWNRCSSTDTWTQLMANAQLIALPVTEYDGSKGTTYALLSRSDRVAWLAFPGVSTNANLKTGEKSGFIKWPNKTNFNNQADVHEYFYKEWQTLRDGGVATWLQNNKSQFDKIIVTGHSKGGVLAQYFVADYAWVMPAKTIHLVAFGSPNSGSKEFVQAWSRIPNLARAKFYTTRGTFKPAPSILNPVPGSTTLDDLITWKEAPGFSMEVFTLTVGGGGTVYPRGLSRPVDNYLTDYYYRLDRQILPVSASGKSNEDFALTIHDDSYYLAGLQQAYKDGKLDRVLPQDIRSVITLETDITKCVSFKDGASTDSPQAQLNDCSESWSQNLVSNGLQFKYAPRMGRCLDLKNSNISKGATVQLYDCNGTNAQKWIYDGIHKTIRLQANPDYCLNYYQGATGNDNEVDLWYCNGNGKQRWILPNATTATAADTFNRIHFALDPHKCIDVAKASTANGTNIQIYHCHLAASQYWHFDGNAIRYYADKNKCLDLSNSNTSNGANIQLYDCNGSKAQQWIYDGITRTFRSGVNLDKCIDLSKGDTTDNTNIQLWDCQEGNTNQQFVIED